MLYSYLCTALCIAEHRMESNNNRKIAVIFGTRPEAIKLVPVINELKRRSSEVDTRVIVTGQHREILRQMLSQFEVAPDLDLDLMTPNQTLAGMTSKAIAALDGYFLEEKPDLVMVQGDTTTSFCAALAAFYHKIPVAHVEAGLRTDNKYSPFPEEMNRQMTTRIATLHFAPTPANSENLKKENITDHIYVTGNTAIDALFLTLDLIKNNKVKLEGVDALNFENIVLITGHRRENFGAGFESICRAISRLAKTFDNYQFIYPVHPNPNVRETVGAMLGNNELKNIHLISPLDYFPFVKLMSMSKIIISDSGGVQEEAPSLGKPVLVIRDTTERPEAIEAGTSMLVGTDENRIYNEAYRLLTDSEAYSKMSNATNPYGDGESSERIVSACIKYLQNSL
jgi:UDP-N-acetylglucosamine 2-epimerase (non-hydrolysing)